MAVKFISYVKADQVGGWYIELVDTLEEKKVICKDMQEYEKQITELGADYGNDIEVEWKRDTLLTIQNYKEIDEQMAKMQEKYKQEIDQINQSKEQ